MPATYPRLLSQQELFALEQMMQSHGAQEIGELSQILDLLRSGKVNLLKDSQGFTTFTADNVDEVFVFLVRRVCSVLHAMLSGEISIERMEQMIANIGTKVTNDFQGTFPFTADLNGV